MAWGCAKVAQRAKKRFRKLHTHEVQAYRKESRGPLVRPSIGVVLECVPNEVGVFLALLLKYLLWKSDYGSKSSCTLEHTLRSLSDTKKTDVSVFQRYHCFLTIQGTRARAGHAPGTMGHLLTYLEPRLVSSSHLGVCYSQSVLSWMVSFFFFCLSFYPGARCKGLCRTQVPSWRGKGHNGFKRQTNFSYPPKAFPSIKIDWVFSFVHSSRFEYVIDAATLSFDLCPPSKTLSRSF